MRNKKNFLLLYHHKFHYEKKQETYQPNKKIVFLKYIWINIKIGGEKKTTHKKIHFLINGMVLTKWCFFSFSIFTKFIFFPSIKSDFFFISFLQYYWSIQLHIIKFIPFFIFYVFLQIFMKMYKKMWGVYFPPYAEQMLIGCGLAKHFK